MANELAPLDQSKRPEYDARKARIKKNAKQFVTTGSDLLHVRDSGEYRFEFQTFEAFLGDVGIPVRSAYNLINAAAVDKVLEDSCNIAGILPNLPQAAKIALSKLPEDKQGPALADAIDKAKEAGKEVPTTAQVKEVVEIFQAQSEPYEEPEGEEPEPPAKAKKAEKIKDANGKTIPEHFNEVFTRGRDSFRDALNLVTQLKKAMNAIASDVLIGPIFAAKGAAGQACRDLDNIRNALRFAMPHAICPYCKGDGCKPCMQAGWVGERVNNSAPPETKK